ncbi:hypothetical protein BDV39DRAFT_205304 [Aspergillus sergii]|uniref:Aspartic peptidase domain-containing protein n=1 Tax=Aspergillus sergii TaxID=1034303 RepID=A0A5N6X1S8_9EURO|nr:hypothetical protein BDV39DRAFT_205304 [Aspergillus sergii]
MRCPIWLIFLINSELATSFFKAKVCCKPALPFPPPEAIKERRSFWKGAITTCTTLRSDKRDLPDSCLTGGPSLNQISTLNDPFFAELPNTLDTGLYRQFMPRINCTANVTKISESEFPTLCGADSGDFSVDYQVNNGSEGDVWRLRACMPTEFTHSRWKPTRARHDFVEELFLNVSLGVSPFSAFSPVNSLYKITMNTTYGYFELPNYMNGCLPGPLLNEDPFPANCSLCMPANCSTCFYQLRRIYDEPPMPDTPFPLLLQKNKGPLLTTAMALFGEASFIQVRLNNTNGYPYNLSETTRINGSYCLEQIPLASFLIDEDTYIGTTGGILYPGSSDAILNPHQQVAQYLQFYDTDTENLKRAFDAAAFFANKAWFESLGTGCRLDFSVYSDPGLDTEVPVMSMASLIVITILLSLHLLILICLTIWATTTERWTGSLDSWAMMRIGGAIADRVPLKIAENTDKMEFLDEIPGWIGDKNDANELVGIIGLGAQGALTYNRRYISYDEDHEEKNPS